MFEENYRLTPDDIAEFNRTGENLDDKKIYIYKFLFNDKWNDATDPRPFRIKPSLIQRLAKDAVGMPYVVNPDPKWHLRGTNEGRPDTAKDLLEIQAKYSIGIIRIPIVKESNNVYGIIEVFPEYESDIPNLPTFTSPTILPLDEDAEGINDAQFLNLNAVEVPGYPKTFSGVHGVCKNGIKECIQELMPLGAAGTLKKSRENSKTFLNNLKSLNKIMSAEQNANQSQDSQPSLTEIKTAIEGVQATTTEVKEKATKIVENVENNNTVLKEVATVTEGVDETKVKEKVDETPTPPADQPPADTPPAKPVGAAGSQRLQIPKELKDNPWVQQTVNDMRDMRQELNDIRKDAQTEKQRKAEELRRKQATSIVEKLILLKQINEEDKDKEIQKYFDLRNEDKTPKDLEVLDNYLKSSIPEEIEPEPLGASGFRIPGMTGDKTYKPMSNAEAMGFDA